jgi:HEAT repeat protein
MDETIAVKEKITKLMKSENEEERLAALGMIQDKSDFDLKLIYSALGDDSWRVRKSATEIFLSWPDTEESIPDIVQCLYSDENAGLRNTAVEILTRLGTLALPRLLDEVNSDDHDVRKFILDILGAIPDERSLPFIQAALKDTDSNVRAAAAENLGKLGDVSAVPALLEALEIQDLLLRFTIFEALGQINCGVPVGRLLAFKDDRLLRKALVDCLSRVGDVSAVSFLIQCLTDDMKNVREAAILAISNLSEKNREVMVGVQQTIMSDNSLFESVVELMQGTALSVRRAAIKLFGWLGDSRSVKYLLERLDDQELQEDAVGSLVALAQVDIQPLLDAWDVADSHKKAYLAYILGDVSSVKSLSRLKEGCLDDNDDLRQMSIQSLGKIGDETVLEHLSRAFADASINVCEAALQGLSQLGERYPAQVASSLQPLLEHENEQIRMYAVTVLGRLDGDNIGEHLVFAIKDESAEVRRAAIRAIEGKVGGDHLSVLMLALTDEDTKVRTLAAKALGKSAKKEAIKPLELALQDEDMWVRAAAVRSIGNLNGREHEHLIVSALQDPVGLVSIAALETLEALGVVDLMKYSENALEHRDAEVVLAALNVLQFNQDNAWIETHRQELLKYPHGEVRLQFAKQLVASEGESCCAELENAVLNENDEFVRQELQLLVLTLKQDQDC